MKTMELMKEVNGIKLIWLKFPLITNQKYLKSQLDNQNLTKIS